MIDPKNQLSIKDLCLIGKGREAEIYSLKSRWVVKLFYSKSEESVAFEKRVQQQLLKLRLPVLQSNGVIEIEERAGIVMEHCLETSMLWELTRKPWKLVSLARELAKFHFQIHSKSMEGIPVEQDRVTKRIARMNDIDAKVKSMALHQLDLLEDGDRICHGDFHPDWQMQQSNRLVKYQLWKSTFGRGTHLINIKVRGCPTGNVMDHEVDYWSRQKCFSCSLPTALF